MTVKNKVDELIYNFRDLSLGQPTFQLNTEKAMRCALLLVEEIQGALGTPCSECQDKQNEIMKYWSDVKSEIVNRWTISQQQPIPTPQRSP